MKLMFSRYAIFTILIFLSTCFAQNPPGDQIETLVVNMDIKDDDGILNQDSVVQVFLAIKNNSTETKTMQIEWEIVTDDWRPLMQMSVQFKVDNNTVRNAYCPWFQFPGPGFYHVSATITLETGNDYSASKVIGINPEKIVSLIDPEDDFDLFWRNSLRELEAITPNFVVEKQKREKNSKTDLYKVEMMSFGNLRVMGWLEVPKKKGIFPALLRVPGYRSNMKPADKYDDLIVFSFNPRSHGDSDDTKDTHLDLWIRGLNTEEEYYYRGAYLDCIRAVDFLASRKDVDQNRIAVWGGSQGGGFSFATAALDPRIDLCISDIPWMSDWPNYFAITYWPEIGDWFAENPDQNWQSMLQTLSYFDTKNMAGKIKCPVIMSISLQDAVCPPSTSFATYNLITSPKEYTVHKHSGHWQPKDHWDKRFVWIREQFGMD